MKKLLLISMGLIFLITSSAQAKNIQVISMDKFSTAHPSKTYSVQVLEKEEFKDGRVYEAGTIITGKVVKVENARRGKRDGYFEFVPTSLTLENTTYQIKNPNITAKVVGHAPIDSKTTTAALMGNAAKGAVGFIFKGASQGISFVEGIKEAEDGKRIKSGFTKVYKDSPLSYIEEGAELKVKEGDLILLKFKKLKTELE